MKFAKLAVAALFVAGSTYALAQTSDQTVDPKVPQKNPSEFAPPPPPPSAAPPSSEGMGSRPIGPPSANNSAGKDNDKNTTNLKKLEKQGRTGNN